jgi:hypothetical protein
VNNELTRTGKKTVSTAVRILLWHFLWDWVKPCKASEEPSAGRDMKAGHSEYDARELQVIRSMTMIMMMTYFIYEWERIRCNYMLLEYS